MVPVLAAPGFAAMENVTVPFPLFPLTELIIIQVALLVTVHAQEFGAVTPMLPVPPLAAILRLDAGSENVQPVELSTIVKLVSEMSKNILPTASTFILAVVVEMFGIATDSEPSLAVEFASTVGKVCPPSVDNKIRTFAALTGAAVVLATFQVTI